VLDRGGVAEEAALTDERPTPLLMGRHLIELGVKPGRKMGDTIRASFQAQLTGRLRPQAGRWNGQGAP